MHQTSTSFLSTVRSNTLIEWSHSFLQFVCTVFDSTGHSALFKPDSHNTWIPGQLSLLSLRSTQSEERNIKDRSTTSTKNWQGYIGTHVIENISEADIGISYVSV